MVKKVVLGVIFLSPDWQNLRITCPAIIMIAGIACGKKTNPLYPPAITYLYRWPS